MKEFLSLLPLALYPIYTLAVARVPHDMPQPELLGVAVFVGALLAALIWLYMQMRRGTGKDKEGNKRD